MALAEILERPCPPRLTGGRISQFPKLKDLDERVWHTFSRDVCHQLADIVVQNVNEDMIEDYTTVTDAEEPEELGAEPSNPVVQALSDGLAAELDRLRKENELLRNRRSNGFYMKVSEKGALSVYGLGRYPLTLYRGQWERLLAMSDQIRSFIKINASRLKMKTE